MCVKKRERQPRSIARVFSGSSNSSFLMIFLLYIARDAIVTATIDDDVALPIVALAAFLSVFLSVHTNAGISADRCPRGGVKQISSPFQDLLSYIIIIFNRIHLPLIGV